MPYALSRFTCYFGHLLLRRLIHFWGDCWIQVVTLP